MIEQMLDDILSTRIRELSVEDYNRKKLPCHWTPDDDGIWEANCGGTFIFESDGPTENGFNFCPFCGKKILPHTGYGDDE